MPIFHHHSSRCWSVTNVCHMKIWQKKLLPQGCKGEDLKRASEDIGLRLFPSLRPVIKKHKDADALLIAEWARREDL